MWKQDWSIPPQDSDELMAWRIYTRVWSDAGLRAPGLWIIPWMRDEIHTDYKMEAIFWYINECKE